MTHIGKKKIPKAISKGFESKLIEYLIKEYFDNNIAEFSEHTGYSKQQLEAWRKGDRKPQKATVRWLLSATLAPEFKVVAEFVPLKITKESEIRRSVKETLTGHADKSGIYAFYDSMCNVLYIGKASSGFLNEMYQQLRAPLGVTFPRAVTQAPIKRWQAVRYMSAYEIPYVDHLDYPKHVEALALRLSKPIGNKVLGRLSRTSPPKER